MRDSKGNELRGPRRRKEQAQYRFNDYDGTVWLLALALGTASGGGACRIGLTRDGGALAIGMYLGDDYGTEYIRPDEDLGSAVREIAAAWGISMPVWDSDADAWIVPLAAKNGRKGASELK